MVSPLETASLRGWWGKGVSLSTGRYIITTVIGTICVRLVTPDKVVESDRKEGQLSYYTYVVRNPERECYAYTRTPTSQHAAP